MRAAIHTNIQSTFARVGHIDKTHSGVRRYLFAIRVELDLVFTETDECRVIGIRDADRYLPTVVAEREIVADLIFQFHTRHGTSDVVRDIGHGSRFRTRLRTGESMRGRIRQPCPTGIDDLARVERAVIVVIGRSAVERQDVLEHVSRRGHRQHHQSRNDRQTDAIAVLHHAPSFQRC